MHRWISVRAAAGAVGLAVPVIVTAQEFIMASIKLALCSIDGYTCD